MESLYVRTCQECGHKQVMKPPARQKSDNWKDAKCMRCNSPGSLDYGSFGWTRDAQGKLVQPPYVEE